MMQYVVLFAVLLCLLGCSNQGFNSKGEKGDQGAIGAIGPQGPSGEAGRDGTNGQDGQNGSNGHDGADGTNGHDGANGQNGTLITPVQLCPGTDHYPNVFVEYALCIDHQLYGVYSANDGFFSLFPPGTYSSNAIGSACSLTVSPNCIVTH